MIFRAISNLDANFMMLLDLAFCTASARSTSESLRVLPLLKWGYLVSHFFFLICFIDWILVLKLSSVQLDWDWTRNWNILKSWWGLKSLLISHEEVQKERVLTFDDFALQAVIVSTQTEPLLRLNEAFNCLILLLVQSLGHVNILVHLLFSLTKF